MWDEYLQDRGSPWEYDPALAKNASDPNSISRLPHGVAWRLGRESTSSNRRALLQGSPSFDYYKITMPAWAAASGAPPLSASEAAAARILRSL